MIGISTSAPMAHADPTSSPGAPRVRRWIEKYQLIAIDADQTSRMAGRNRAIGPLRRTAPMPVRRGSVTGSHPAKGDRDHGKHEHRADIDREEAGGAGTLDGRSGAEGRDDERGGAPCAEASVPVPIGTYGVE